MLQVTYFNLLLVPPPCVVIRSKIFYQKTRENGCLVLKLHSPGLGILQYMLLVRILSEKRSAYTNLHETFTFAGKEDDLRMIPANPLIALNWLEGRRCKIVQNHPSLLLSDLNHTSAYSRRTCPLLHVHWCFCLSVA